MITRDEAFKICDTLLAHAKSAGAEDASISVNGSVEAYARFADNRVTTSGRAENLAITTTVWVDGRRGSISGNDTGADALKQMAEDAVQIARVSPVHREYVPTLGPVDYPESGGFSESTADVNVDARASALLSALEACRREQVIGAGFHIATASARAVATASGNRQYFRSGIGRFSMTARTTDGTGSGYYAGDHFDLTRLDVRQIAEQAVTKAVRSQAPKAIEPGTYSVILEPQAVADMLGFLGNALDARSAEEGRSAFAAKDGKTRVGEKMFSERIRLYSDPQHPELPAVPATDEGIAATACSKTSSTRVTGRSSASGSRRPGRSTSSSKARARPCRATRWSGA
jgi:predicted Zn-dependent protease